MSAGDTSAALFARALTLLPGGVDSPVRAFGAVGGTPKFIDHGAGCRVVDVDGRDYVDFVLSWGPLLLGHAHPAVVRAVQEAAARGLTFGAPHAGEVALAERIRGAMPSLELLRFVNSGTEATMSAVRVARAHTGRSRLLKFEGCYHGHADHFLSRAGSGALTLGLPDSPGVPAAVAAAVVTVPYNDLAAAAAAFAPADHDIAALIVEPVAGNMGVVPPAPGFLEGLRNLATAHGAVLIFDEVMSGFRVHPGGAQALHGVTPDLTTLGKVIGGGMPVGAYGGRRDLMALVAPAGPVYQAGTLSGNPVAMAAGLATFEAMEAERAWLVADAAAAEVEAALRWAAARHGVPLTVNRVGTMLTAFFTGEPVTDLASAQHADRGAFARWFHRLLDAGVFWAPSQFESVFLSAAHDADALAAARAAFDTAFSG